MELISIVDCDLCVTLPADQTVTELPLPETWGSLSTILVRRDWHERWSVDPARYSSALDIDIEQIRVCRACGTYYHYKQVHDPHFGEPRDPETDWYLRRLTPTDARTDYLDRADASGAIRRLDTGWLDRRHEAIIGLLRRDLPRAPDWQIERHAVDSLYMHYVHRQDWEGLRATLIDYPEQAVGVYVADRIFLAVDPENPARGLAASTQYWDSVSALLAADPAREPLLVAVLAGGLSAPGRIMKLFLYPTRWEPVTVAGYAMYTLRTYLPRRSLSPAIPALARALQEPDPARGWLRDSVRDLLMEYVEARRERAKAVLEALAGETEEALAVRTHCQRCLGP